MQLIMSVRVAKMTRTISLATLASLCMLTVHAQTAAPRYQVDPFWPKPFKDPKWMIQAIPVMAQRQQITPEEFRVTEKGLNYPGPAEQTLLLAPGGEDLDDRLDPSGQFDPEQWLFEQLSLRLPLVNRCGAECPGPATWSSETDGGDPRWAALRSLRED